MPTTYDGLILDQGGAVYNARSSAYGAKGDGKIVSNGAINSGSTTLTSVSAPFASTDVGKLVVVAGAGASGTPLSTTIASYTNSTTVTLAAAAGTTVPSARTVFGTNDTNALQAALNAAGVVGGTDRPGGTVIFEGISLINLMLTVPEGVSLCGHGGVLMAAGSAFDADNPMLKVDATAEFGNRFGVLRDFQIDGNRVATVGLHVGLAVERDFYNLRVTGCTSVGTRVQGTQNCTFVSVNNEDNGSTGEFDTNLLIDLGAGNNAFLRCECTANTIATNQGRYNLVIRQSSASPSGAFPAGPEGNAFYRCIFERASSAFIAQVYQRAGRFNYLQNCSISTDGTGISAVKATAEDVTEGSGFLSSHLVLRDCELSGGSNATAFELLSFKPLIVGDLLIELFTDGFRIDDASFVEIEGRIDGAPTNFYVRTGSNQLSQLVSGGRIATYSPNSNGTPVNPIEGSGYEYFNPTTGRRWVWDGSRWWYAQYA